MCDNPFYVGLRLVLGPICIALCCSGCTRNEGITSPRTPHVELVGLTDARFILEIDGKFVETETVLHVKMDQLHAVFDPATTRQYSAWEIRGLWSNPSLDWPYVVEVDNELVRAKPSGG